MLFIYFDGLCEPINPGGIATYGYIVLKEEEKIREEAGFVGAGYRGDDVSNNVAEYTALIRALEWLVSEGKFRNEGLVIRGDSQLVIMQIKGKYKVRASRLIPLHSKVMELLRQFPSYEAEWVPRRYNAEADQLTRRALKMFVKENYSEASQAYGEEWVELVLNDPQ